MHCVTLIGGIPGSGKTELCKFLLNNKECIFEKFSLDIRNDQNHNDIQLSTTLDRNARKSLLPQIHVIAVDDLCSLDDQSKIVQTLTGWKNFRVELLEAAERYICEVCNIESQLQGPLSRRSHELLEKLRELNQHLNTDVAKDNDIIFLVEDNFYYRSMRYAWFQLARRDHLGFCQVFLKCPLEVAIRRNSLRYQKIPEHLIGVMNSCLEYPDAGRNSWESFSVVLDNVKQLDYDHLLPIVSLIQKAIYQPVVTVLKKDQIESQIICSKNVVHQVDKVLRKLTGRMIKDAKARIDGTPPPSSIKDILEYRHELLQQLKDGSLQLPVNIVESVEECGINERNASYELETVLEHMFSERCHRSNYSGSLS